jgi:hypothetical protein
VTLHSRRAFYRNAVARMWSAAIRVRCRIVVDSPDKNLQIMASKHSNEIQAQFADEIVNAMERYAVDQIPPHPSYHFTTLSGLQGILTTRSFWVTLATASNDSTELVYALSRARNLLSLRTSSPDPSFCSEVIELLDPAHSVIVSNLGWKVYLMSFRTNVDGSGHWKEYGDSGRGAALAFGMKPLVVPGLLFLPVIYDPAHQDRLVEGFIDSVAHLVKRLSQNWPSAEARNLRKLSIHLTALGIWTLAPLMKGPNFHDEQEWRLIVVDVERAPVRHEENVSKQVFHRQGGGRDIPYKELRYGALPLLGIELGLHAPIGVDDSILTRLASDASPGREVQISRSRVTPG